MLGTVEVPEDSAACAMPVSVQIDRLRRELASRFEGGFRVLSTDLYSLEGAERDAALDAVVAGEPSPFVLMDGRMVCVGAVEIDAVLAALSEQDSRV